MLHSFNDASSFPGSEEYLLNSATLKTGSDHRTERNRMCIKLTVFGKMDLLVSFLRRLNLLFTFFKCFNLTPKEKFTAKKLSFFYTLVTCPFSLWVVWFKQVFEICYWKFKYKLLFCGLPLKFVQLKFFPEKFNCQKFFNK